MKKRRFADGGETDPDVEMANASDDPIAYMNKAKRWTDTEEAPAKRKVVTKEELEKSGLSLRDYMNKQQGLKRKATPYTGSGGSGGGRGPTAEELKRGSGGGRGPSANEMAPALTREERMDRIPRDKGEPAVNPITGSELGRNIKNTLNATAGLTGIQLAKAAAEGLTAPRAAATAAAAKKAELAGELRRGATPTKFTSPSKTTTAKRTRKFNDDEAGVEMKKGGKVAKYAAGGAVKGWGQARGARAAKIV